MPSSSFPSQKLNVPPAEVQELLVFLILDNKVVGQIDQVKQQLHLQKGYAFILHLLALLKAVTKLRYFLSSSGPVAKYRYIGKWGDQLHSLHGTILNRVS